MLLLLSSALDRKSALRAGECDAGVKTFIIQEYTSNCIVVYYYYIVDIYNIATKYSSTINKYDIILYTYIIIEEYVYMYYILIYYINIL